jgi:hypothetical protein
MEGSEKITGAASFRQVVERAMKKRLAGTQKEVFHNA